MDATRIRKNIQISLVLAASEKILFLHYLLVLSIIYHEYRTSRNIGKFGNFTPSGLYKLDVKVGDELVHDIISQYTIEKLANFNLAIPSTITKFSGYTVYIGSLLKSSEWAPCLVTPPC